jgi:hypothetical protein
VNIFLVKAPSKPATWVPVTMTLDENTNFQTISKQTPRIAESLRLLWGCAEFEELVRNLLTDSCDGERRGFPLKVAQALFRLAEDHEAQFPQFTRGRVPLAEVIPKMIRDTYWKRRPR